MVQFRRSSLVFVLALGEVVFALSTSNLAEVASSPTHPNASALLQRRHSGRMRVDQWLAVRRSWHYNSSEHRQHKYTGSQDRSTSSDTKSDRVPATDDGDLDLSVEQYDTKSEKQTHNKYIPISTEERKGWRKWHRKCTPCDVDMQMRWRDPEIKWVCGAYQRARRSFKSECMMHHRNCQDGTMFVKIYDNRCKDDETGRFGTHFFYEYKVKSTESGAGTSDPDYEEESDSYSPARRALKRRAGISVRSVSYASIKPRLRVYVVARGTPNNSIAIDLRNAYSNITTKDGNISLPEVINTTSRIYSRYFSEVRDGNESRLTSNVTAHANYPNKVVEDFATRIQRVKLNSVASVTRRVHNGDLGEAIRAVSNFGLSLAKFTPYYGTVGRTQSTVRRSKPQTNKQNSMLNHHIESTSPNLPLAVTAHH